MYRVTVYRNELMIAKFIEDIMSQAIGKARRIGLSGDQVYVHEVIQTSDGNFDEVECTLKTTIWIKLVLAIVNLIDITI